MPVRLSKTIIIPAKHEIIAPVHISTQASEVVIESCYSLSSKHNLSVGNTLSDVREGEAKVRLVNSTDKDICLKEGVRVGDASVTMLERRFSDSLPDVNAKSPPWSTILNQFDICKSLNSSERTALITLLTDYSDIVSFHSFDLGRTAILKHKINTGDAAPIKCRPYRHSIAEQQELDKMIAAFLEARLIRESSSPWSAPVVLVRKKDGGYRFCVDWRQLNAVTKKDSMPLPRIDDTLHRLHGSKYFSTIDFTSGYHQVEMEEESIEKTAFATQTGLYEFTVMGMGLTNSPATFTRLITQMLRPLQWKNCLSYLDDLIIYSPSFTDHLTHLKSVFDIIRKSGLKVKPSKCTLAQPEVEFLGHIVSAAGISPNPKKLSAVKNWSFPSNVKELQSFLGLGRLL